MKPKRQPKAGELASRGSPRFAVAPRAHAADNFAPAMVPARPASEKEAFIIPAHIKIKKLPARVARGAFKPRLPARGDAPTITHAIRYTGVVAAQPQHGRVRELAARGWNR